MTRTTVLCVILAAADRYTWLTCRIHSIVVTGILVIAVVAITIAATLNCVRQRFPKIGRRVTFLLLTSKKKQSSIYFVEYSNQRERSESPELTLEENTYQQPMTPRKVKRQNRYRSSGRSQKGTLNRGTNPRSSQGRGTYGRTSQRSRRPHYLNPVTQLIERANESSTSTDSFRPPAFGARPTTTFGGRQGHCNPMYVHSRPGSTFSIGSNDVERPPSVHSSYSNYHGQRTALIAPNMNPNGRPAPLNAFLRQPQLNSSFADSQNGGYSTLKGSVCSDNSDMPPPYMFGVNSETVI